MNIEDWAENSRRSQLHRCEEMMIGSLDQLPSGCPGSVIPHYSASVLASIPDDWSHANANVLVTQLCAVDGLFKNLVCNDRVAIFTDDPLKLYRRWFARNDWTGKVYFVNPPHIGLDATKTVPENRRFQEIGPSAKFVMHEAHKDKIRGFPLTTDSETLQPRDGVRVAWMYVEREAQTIILACEQAKNLSIRVSPSHIEYEVVGLYLQELGSIMSPTTTPVDLLRQRWQERFEAQKILLQHTTTKEMLFFLVTVLAHCQKPEHMIDYVFCWAKNKEAINYRRTMMNGVKIGANHNKHFNEISQRIDELLSGKDTQAKALEVVRKAEYTPPFWVSVQLGWLFDLLAHLLRKKRDNLKLLNHVVAVARRSGAMKDCLKMLGIEEPVAENAIEKLNGLTAPA